MTAALPVAAGHHRNISQQISPLITNINTIGFIDEAD